MSIIKKIIDFLKKIGVIRVGGKAGTFKGTQEVDPLDMN